MRKMTKNIIAIVSTVAITLSMGIMSFAAGSPVAGVTTPTKEVVLKEATQKPDLADEKIVEVVKGSGIFGTAELPESVKVIASFDVEIASNWTAGQEIVFKVPSVTANSKVAVLHFKGNEWVVEPSTVGAGTITIKPDSLSPFAIVADTTTLAAGTSGSTTSPKTGESATVMLVGMLAIVACAVAITSRKRA